jgi:hypothetical protein
MYRKILKTICFFLYVGKNYRSFSFSKGEYINHSITCEEAWVLADIATNREFENIHA